MKCPVCGYDSLKEKNYSVEIRTILQRMDIDERQHLRKVMQIIQTQVPSDNNQMAYYIFLMGIKDIDKEIVMRSIKTFLTGNLAYTGKGFSYLRSMILNAKTNYKKMLENERKKIGSVPKEFKK